MTDEEGLMLSLDDVSVASHWGEEMVHCEGIRTVLVVLPWRLLLKGVTLVFIYYDHRRFKKKDYALCIDGLL